MLLAISAHLKIPSTLFGQFQLTMQTFSSFNNCNGCMVGNSALLTLITFYLIRRISLGLPVFAKPPYRGPLIFNWLQQQVTYYGMLQLQAAVVGYFADLGYDKVNHFKCTIWQLALGTMQ